MMSQGDPASPSGERQCKAAWKQDPSIRCQGINTELTVHAGRHRGFSSAGQFIHWGDDEAQLWQEPKPPCATCRGMVSGICPMCGRVKQPAMTAESPASHQVGGLHYQRAIQPWEIIEVWGLDFWRGNALKYLLRAGNKGSAVEDLKKARHYLDYLIEKGERGQDE